MKKNTTISGKGSAAAGRGVLLGVMLAMALLLPCIYQALHAQRFDWVQSLVTQDDRVSIKSMQTDKEGNLYILAEFDQLALWNGHHINPYITRLPIGAGHFGTLLAKLSPEGDLLWKKMWTGYAKAIDMRIIGDTTVDIMVTAALPGCYSSDQGRYIYIVDTLIECGTRNYPFRSDSLNYDIGTLYYKFGLDGTMLESHRLNLTFDDKNGRTYGGVERTVDDLSKPVINYYNDDVTYRGSFDVDSKGNIYLAREIHEELWFDCDTCPLGVYVANTANGGLVTANILVDAKTRFKIKTENALRGNIHLMKFSPHFDSLISSRFVCERIDWSFGDVSYISEYPSAYYGGNGLDISSSACIRVVDTDVYVMFQAERLIAYKTTVLMFDTLHNVSYAFDSGEYWDYHGENAFLLSYDSMFGFRYMKTLDYHEGGWANIPRVWFRGMQISGDTLFLSVSTDAALYPLDLNAPDTSFSYEGTYVPSKYEPILALDRHDGHLLTTYALSGPGVSHQNYRSQYQMGFNDHYVSQLFYSEGGYTSDDTTVTVGRFDRNTGLAIYDRNGTSVHTVDFHSTANYSSGSPANNCVGITAMHDSIIYGGLYFKNQAVLGDIPIYPTDYYHCIFKYVDPRLAAPYITLRAETVSPRAVPSVYPNPTAGKVTLDMEGEQLAEASLTAMSGVTVPVVCKGGAIDLSGCADGQYVLRVATTAGNVYTYKVIVKR